MVQNKQILMIAIILCALSAGILLYLFTDKSLPPDQKIHIRYTVSVQNPTSHVIKNATVQVRGPIEKTAFQQRIRIDADRPFKSIVQPYESILHFKWDIIPPYATKIMTVRSDIELWKEPRKTDTNDLTEYLEPEPMIESDDAGIKALAAQLKTVSPQETIRKIFAWVSEKIVYIGYTKRTRGAAYALRYGEGDCTEYAHLFVALCRANDIPARVVGGFVCPNSGVLDLGDYHNWAEFYHNGRWHVADPQRKNLMSEQSTYIAFQIVRPSKQDKGSIIVDAGAKELKVSLNR